MLLAPFIEKTLKGVTLTDTAEDDGIFEGDDVRCDWQGLLTPPWSPCDSSMDELDDCGRLTEPVTSLRARCDSFLCSCTSCECSCLEHAEGPVLRDCMWSETTGLLPPTLTAAAPATPDAEQCRPSCRAATSVCSNHTDRCVDPKNVFPCQTGVPTAPAPPSQPVQSVNVVKASTATSTSPLYEPDSETSAYCSSFSDEELEEIDVVSVTSTGWQTEDLLMVDGTPERQSPVLHRQMLVLPAAESMSAQVAAMHNYSNPRCRPTPPVRPSMSSFASRPPHNKCASSRTTSRCKKRNRGRRAMTSAAVGSPASGSDWSSDSGVHEDERHRRAQHNVMERQRRYHLKSHFYSLRDVVPGTRGDGRVSKVAILRRAVDHIRHLASLHHSLQQELDRQNSLQERFKWKLSLVNRDMRSTGLSSC